MKKLRKNDEVVVIAGKDKGASGRILNIDFKNNKVTVDKINIVKKHVKPTQTNPDGGIQEVEAPIHISNIALKTKGKGKEKESTSTRVGFKIVEGKKTRIAKKTGKAL